MPTRFSLPLPRERTASSIARRAVRERLGGLVPTVVLADTLLGVSELVSNAVLHGVGRIELRVDADAVRVRAEVIDEGTGFEHRVRRDGDVGGRGLLIVGQLAESWGIHEGTTHVWFEIRVDIPAGPPERPQLPPEKPQLGHSGGARLPGP